MSEDNPSLLLCRRAGDALGNIQFIGNLYQNRMLTEKIMHGCITELLTEVGCHLPALQLIPAWYVAFNMSCAWDC